MRLLILIAIMCLYLPSKLSGQPIDTTLLASSKIQKFDPVRDADKDIKDAIVRAKKEQKRILLDVGGEWCIWCHRLDSLFILNKDLEDYLTSHYVVVKINVSKENKNEKVLAKYPQIAGYPHLFILEEDGTLLQSQDTGELEYPSNLPRKGHDKDKVFTFLKKWAKGK
jgi:thioredoxin-related protein